MFYLSISTQVLNCFKPLYNPKSLAIMREFTLAFYTIIGTHGCRHAKVANQVFVKEQCSVVQTQMGQSTKFNQFQKWVNYDYHAFLPI